MISSLTHWFFKNMFLVVTDFLISHFSFCYWFLTSSYCGWKSDFVWHLSYNSYWDLTCGLTQGPSQRRSHAPWRRTGVLSLGAVLRASIESGWVIVLFKSSASYLLSGCSVHYCEWGIQFPTIIIQLFLPSIFRVFASYSVIWGKTVYNSYIFLLIWNFY